MQKWDITVNPSKHVCPETFCFFWREDKCDEAYRAFDRRTDCVRRPSCLPDARDWYEPCEPELDRAGLPHDYFVAG